MPTVRKPGLVKTELVNGERVIRRVKGARRGGPELSPRRAAFCRAYALGICIDNSENLKIRFNTRQAAIAAGYAQRGAHNRGCELLGLDEIQREVQRLVDSTAAKQELDAQEILRRLDEIYARCMQAEPVLDEHGSESGEWRFNASGATRACELIGRYLRMWQAEGQINVNVTVDQARDFARGFARRVLTLIEEHVSDPDERRRLIGSIGQEALRDG